MKKPYFLQVDTDSWKRKFDGNVLGCHHSGLRTQKLALSQEAISVLNWPF